MQKISLYRSPWMRAASITACVLLAVFIFSMSAEPAAASGDRSTGIAEQILSAVVSDWEQIEQHAQNRILSSVEHILRKTAHFCIYAALGAILCLSSLGFDATWRVHALRSLLIGALYAASDELHQAFVPGRGPAVTDVLLDSAGVLCGIAVMLLFVWLALRKKN